jgi:hypothetical protein
MTGAERIQRYRAKHGIRPPAPTPSAAATATVAPLQARIVELEARNRTLAAENTMLRIENRLLPQRERQIKSLKTQLQHLQRDVSQRPPLPPDEQRDLEIQSLKMVNQELRRRLRSFREHHEKEMQRAGGMNFQTRAAIAKCLHPDHAMTDAERDHALRLFNQFVTDSRKVNR